MKHPQENNKKKKILFHTNHSKAFTGFGKNCRNILSYLYATDKYEIVEACNGMQKSNPSLSKLPWKCVGTLPDDQSRIDQINKDPNIARAASYGAEMIDELIKEVKPDIYIGAEDIWGFTDYWKKKWWNKINCMIWTTLDSEPLLPLSLDAAPHIKNYYVWASFAEKGMHKAGFEHVKMLRGSLNTDTFFSLPQEKVSVLRKRQLIDSNCFLIGFVFRNQLRKSVPNLLDGYALFKERNPSVNAKLLLHTHWGEGWDIPRLIKEKGLNNLDIFTTYYCSSCKQYEIKPFDGQGLKCKYCGSEKTQNTTNVSSGVSEPQLNEIYNLMDVYCHPFTSGGQEIPVQEAKLTKLITLVTNYSCGEDSCTNESGGLPLEWAEYREPGTQFIKASTYPSSIAKQLTKVYKMSPAKRLQIGERARKFTIDNFSTDVIGAQLEKILDNFPVSEWDFDFTEKPRNPNYTPPDIKDDSDWLCDLYKNILNMDVTPEVDDGHKYWTQEISKGKTREVILDYFRKVAAQENSEIVNAKNLEDLLSDTPREKRIGVLIPGSGGDVLWINSLLDNLKNLYPDHYIYVLTNPLFFPLIEDHPNVHKTLSYQENIDNLLTLEGQGSHSGYFDIAFLPHIGTQKIFNYQHNGKDKTQFELR